jgi:hypothetical protein
MLVEAVIGWVHLGPHLKGVLPKSLWGPFERRIGSLAPSNRPAQKSECVISNFRASFAKRKMLWRINSVWATRPSDVDPTALPPMRTLRFNVTLCFIASLCAALPGCTSGSKQIREEKTCARFLARILAFYEDKYPNTAATNLQQIFESTQTPYPKHWHYRFQKFRQHAGFQNSFYEKYVIVSLRLPTNIVPGQVYLMNAQPFPNEKGEKGRLLLFKTQVGRGDWQIEWFPEKVLQRFFREAGQNIPKPSVVPSFPDLPSYEEPPFSSRMQDFFGDVTANLGLGTASGKYLMYATFGLLTIGAVLVILLGVRKRE